MQNEEKKDKYLKNKDKFYSKNMGMLHEPKQLNVRFRHFIKDNISFSPILF